MTMQYRFGLFEGAALDDDEVRAVLARTEAPCVTERIDGRFYDVMLDGEELLRSPTDERAVSVLAALFDGGASEVSPEEASHAELCVLVPMSQSRDFRIACAIASVPGWSFKNLEPAYTSLVPREGVDPKALADLKRALELGVVVVFGERA